MGPVTESVTGMDMTAAETVTTTETVTIVVKTTTNQETMSGLGGEEAP
jgi:hypothetical protein